MNPYTLFNAALAVLVLTSAYRLLPPERRRTDALLSARIGVLVSLLSYPWDFFAITMRVWRYPVHPGSGIYGVPINDLIFIWLCTVLTTSLLVRLHRGKTGGERHSESKNASQ
jgi:lycopene cyclase domain-containing protein